MAEYEFISRLSEDISYMRGKVDATFQSIEKINENTQRMLQLHDDKIKEITLFHENVKGRVAVMGSLFGVVSGAVTAWITRHFL